MLANTYAILTNTYAMLDNTYDTLTNTNVILTNTCNRDSSGKFMLYEIIKLGLSSGSM